MNTKCYIVQCHCALVRNRFLGDKAKIINKQLTTLEDIAGIQCIATKKTSN